MDGGPRSQQRCHLLPLLHRRPNSSSLVDSLTQASFGDEFEFLEKKGGVNVDADGNGGDDGASAENTLLVITNISAMFICFYSSQYCPTFTRQIYNTQMEQP